MNCLSVLRQIIESRRLDRAKFTLVEHTVGLNWRQKYPTVDLQAQHVAEGLVQQLPIRRITLTGREVANTRFSPQSMVTRDDTVMSISSKVSIRRGSTVHLALMNLHPADSFRVDDVAELVAAVTDQMDGYLLETGRFWHFYGFHLLSDESWLRFLAQFLMPVVLVSPRYVGHSLYRGYTTLRLTTEQQYKPVLPFVVRTLGAPGEAGMRPQDGPVRGWRAWRAP